MKTEKGKAILNGVVGDYLDATGNDLATEMAFYQDGMPLDLSNLTAQASRICVLVHGLTDDESTWQFNDTDYGRLLQRDLSIEPMYLRYNTGLHVSSNGEKLSCLMEQLLLNVTTEIREIIFLCHSMGGLVTRSACLDASKHRRPWVKSVRRIVFLGTPHHGSFWEKAGNVVSSAMGGVPRPYMRLAADVANLRSAGIKDLRYGYVQNEDWEGQHPDAFLTNTKKSADLLDWVTYHIVTGTVTKNPRHPVSLCLGDALVRKHSAEGRSDNKDHNLGISSDQIREFAGVGHLQLPSNPIVYSQIKEWIEQPWEKDHTESTVVLQTDEPNAKLCKSIGSPASMWAQCKGLATLVETAVDKGATAVEGVQHELTSEVYGVLTKMPLIAPTAKSVEVVHEACVVGIYNIIRGVNRGVGMIAKHAFDKLDENERADEMESS